MDEDDFDVWTVVLPVIGMAFTAFCAWLTVRIVNRRERWAKWTAVAVVGLPLLYVLSFGPACWLSSRMRIGTRQIPVIYAPIVWTISKNELPIGDVAVWYARIGAASDWGWDLIPIEADENTFEWRWRWVRMEDRLRYRSRDSVDRD